MYKSVLKFEGSGVRRFGNLTFELSNLSIGLYDVFKIRLQLQQKKCSLFAFFFEAGKKSDKFEY